MEIRLITVKEDFEKAYNILNQKEYPLSFYEYNLKHDHFQNNDKLKLIGFFKNDNCIGTISYRVTLCPILGKILEIRELHHHGISAYVVLMDFIDQIAHDEKCYSIKICKNRPDRLNYSIFDRFESFLKNLIN